ncbi:hypothetical protein ACC728_39440, partial [Rhizobium ruizarguesonis]
PLSCSFASLPMLKTCLATISSGALLQTVSRLDKPWGRTGGGERLPGRIIFQAAAFSGEVFRKPVDRSLPCELGCCFVVS